MISEEPIEYFDGMFRDDEDLRSVRSLLALIQEHVAAAGEVQLYPVWDGEEDKPPKGTIHLRLDALQPETFFFTQHFLYRITRDADRAGDLDAQ